jgi:hypothetical protein
MIPFISIMDNGTLLSFGNRYEDDLRVIFDQWPKLHLGLDALSNQKILKGIYHLSTLSYHSISVHDFLPKWMIFFHLTSWWSSQGNY